MRRRLILSWLLCLLYCNGLGHAQRRSGDQLQAYPARAPAVVDPPRAPPVNDGHRMITRALWRIFDALMEKKQHVKRMTQVEDAVKAMITSDTKLEEEVRKMKEDVRTVKLQTTTLMNEIERIKGMNTRLNDLENWQLTLQRQGDQNIKAAYSGCPDPYVYVEGECFYVEQDSKLTWQDARRHCAKLSGGDLSAPRDLHKLRRHLEGMTKSPDYVWIGGMRAADDTWQWLSSSEPRPMDMSHDTWNDDLPSSIGDCVGLYEGANYRAYDYNCTEEDYFVCQYVL